MRVHGEPTFRDGTYLCIIHSFTLSLQAWNWQLFLNTYYGITYLGTVSVLAFQTLASMSS